MRYNVKVKVPNPESYDGKEFYHFNDLSALALDGLIKFNETGNNKGILCVEEVHNV